MCANLNYSIMPNHHHIHRAVKEQLVVISGNMKLSAIEKATTKFEGMERGSTKVQQPVNKHDELNKKAKNGMVFGRVVCFAPKTNKYQEQGFEENGSIDS